MPLKGKPTVTLLSSTETLAGSATLSTVHEYSVVATSMALDRGRRVDGGGVMLTRNPLGARLDFCFLQHCPETWLAVTGSWP